jgi:hypothetical protein
LSDTYSINMIRFGEDRSNTAAIRAYEKNGFFVDPTADIGGVSLKVIFTS